VVLERAAQLAAAPRQILTPVYRGAVGQRAIEHADIGLRGLDGRAEGGGRRRDGCGASVATSQTIEVLDGGPAAIMG
jgi:hypothetical protein